MKVTCERCMYWDNSHEEERAQGRSGFCRQSPPHPEWHWALTDPHDWCGQAMPKDTRASKYYQEEDEDSLKKELVETIARLNDSRVRVEKEMEAKLLDRDACHKQLADALKTLKELDSWYKQNAAILKAAREAKA